MTQPERPLFPNDQQAEEFQRVLAERKFHEDWKELCKNAETSQKNGQDKPIDRFVLHAFQLKNILDSMPASTLYEFAVDYGESVENLQGRGRVYQDIFPSPDSIDLATRASTWLQSHDINLRREADTHDSTYRALLNEAISPLGWVEQNFGDILSSSDKVAESFIKEVLGYVDEKATITNELVERWQQRVQLALDDLRLSEFDSPVIIKALEKRLQEQSESTGRAADTNNTKRVSHAEEVTSVEEEPLTEEEVQRELALRREIFGQAPATLREAAKQGGDLIKWGGEFLSQDRSKDPYLKMLQQRLTDVILATEEETDRLAGTAPEELTGRIWKDIVEIDNAAYKLAAFAAAHLTDVAILGLTPKALPKVDGIDGIYETAADNVALLLKEGQREGIFERYFQQINMGHQEEVIKRLLNQVAYNIANTTLLHTLTRLKSDVENYNANVEKAVAQ